MKIVFLCGSVEAGRDGVGDYVRRLSSVLSEDVEAIGVVSLNESSISEVHEEGGPVWKLRLPDILSWEERYKLLKRKIEEFNPDWISLQFVPFSFDKKGLPYRLAEQLGTIDTKAKWHLMFHELWVGMEKDASFKFRLWGWVQKMIIKTLLRKLAPVVVHTQTELYREQLSLLGINAKKLPLFGNIPLRSSKRRGTAERELVFVLFGNIHFGAPVQDFINDVVKLQQLTGKQATLKAVGRSGSEVETWRALWEQAGLKFLEYGETAETEISEILSGSDIGLTTTPAVLVEKSGTVAAMREHKLPVLCVSRRWEVAREFRCKTPDGVFIYESGMFVQKFEDILAAKFKAEDPASVSHQFIQDLYSYG